MAGFKEVWSVEFKNYIMMCNLNKLIKSKGFGEIHLRLYFKFYIDNWIWEGKVICETQ